MGVEKIYESPWQIPLHNRDKRKPIGDLTYEHAPKRTVSIAVITYASVDDATTFTMGNKYTSTERWLYVSYSFHNS